MSHFSFRNMILHLIFASFVSTYLPRTFARGEILLSDGDIKLVCQQENDTAKPSGLPTLPKMFDAHVEVTDLERNITFSLHEYTNSEQTALFHLFGGDTTKCNYKTHDQQGYVVKGIQCNWTHDLPRECFCLSSGCIPYIPLSTLFNFLRENGVVYNGHGLVRNIPSESWTLKCSSPENITNILNIQIAFSQQGHEMPSGKADIPLTITVQSQGTLLDVNQLSIDLSYEITQFQDRPIFNKEIFLPPAGVYCRFPKVYRPLPSLANLFSVTMETVLNDKHVISYIQHHYDALEKLVSFNVRSHRHGEVSMGSTFQAPGSGNRFHVVHDFESGIQYMIDETTNNCSITAIPLASFDVALDDSAHVRLRHANELLSTDTDQFMYAGERLMRGIPCEVWVTEKPLSEKGEYVTVEVYFSQENWNVEVEVVNQEQLAPMGISTYVAKSPSALNFSNVIHTYLFGYSVGHPNWKNFDISQCLSRSNRLFLVFTLKVSYIKLAEYGWEVVEDSVRRVVAEMAGISPLRVTNLFLTNSQSPDEVDVWFVLLEHPNVVGDASGAKASVPLSEAHRILKNLIDQQDQKINLVLSTTKMSVLVKKGSLETTSESLHPNSRQKRVEPVKRGYTAGSMAALGFSMVILGACVGLLVGILLWRKGSNVPYLVHD